MMTRRSNSLCPTTDSSENRNSGSDLSTPRTKKPKTGHNTEPKSRGIPKVIYTSTRIDNDENMRRVPLPQPVLEKSSNSEVRKTRIPAPSPTEAIESPRHIGYNLRQNRKPSILFNSRMKTITLESDDSMTQLKSPRNGRILDGKAGGGGEQQMEASPATPKTKAARARKTAEDRSVSRGRGIKGEKASPSPTTKPKTPKAEKATPKTLEITSSPSVRRLTRSRSSSRNEPADELNDTVEAKDLPETPVPVKVIKTEGSFSKIKASVQRLYRSQSERAHDASQWLRSWRDGHPVFDKTLSALVYCLILSMIILCVAYTSQTSAARRMGATVWPYVKPAVERIEDSYGRASQAVKQIVNRVAGGSKDVVV